MNRLREQETEEDSLIGRAMSLTERCDTDRRDVVRMINRFSRVQKALRRAGFGTAATDVFLASTELLRAYRHMDGEATADRPRVRAALEQAHAHLGHAFRKMWREIEEQPGHARDLVDAAYSIFALREDPDEGVR